MVRVVQHDQVTCARLGCRHVRAKHKGKCEGLHYDPFGPTAAPCACTAFVEPEVRPPAAALPAMVSLRLRWEGQPPVLGDYLMSTGHSTKFGYKIIELRRVGQTVVRKLTTVTPDLVIYEVDALKVPAKEVPAGAVIHPWKWDPRDRKNKTGTAWGEVVNKDWVRCFRMGCRNPVVHPTRKPGAPKDLNDDELPACSSHGGETRIVWAVYRQSYGWLTDNDTIVDWEHDVDQARWFPSETAVSDLLADLELDGDGPDDIAIVRIK